MHRDQATRWSPSGFTLIELMIVVAIIGILAAIALATFQNLTQSAQIATEDGVLGAMNSMGVILLGKLGRPPTGAEVIANLAPQITDVTQLAGVPNVGHDSVVWCQNEMFVAATTQSSHPTNHAHVSPCP